MKISDLKFEDLKVNYTKYISYLEKIHESFGGPSVHFHGRALEEGKMQFLSNTHLEMTYAVLASWGMHRMGNTKTKMVGYSQFQESILQFETQLRQLKDLQIQDFKTEPFDVFEKLVELCFAFKVSVSESKLVGNSKTLAHILPNLVPPIDRQYTIRFFSENLFNFRGDEEIKYFRHIISRMYQFTEVIREDRSISLDLIFNTSYPKIFDNLIMAYIKTNNNNE